MLATAFVTRRWETSTRYYEARIVSDLFGNLVLEKIWGSLHSHLGGHQVVAVGAEDCQRVLLVIEKERSHRGYKDVSVESASVTDLLN